MNPSHRSRNHDRAAIAVAQALKHAVLRDSVRRIEEIAAQSTIVEVRPVRAHRASQSPLIVVHAFATHRLRDALPKPEGSRAFAREHGAAGEGMRVHAIRDGDVDGGVAEEIENVAIRVGIAGENVGVEDEGELKGEVRVVHHARVPLMSYGDNVAMVHGDDD